MNKAQYKINSQIGVLFLVASEKGLRGIFFEKQNVPVAKALEGSAPELKILKRCVKELEEYFRGERQAFALPLDLHGTEFQKRVWNQLSKIPYGETRSYKDIAAKIKNAKAVRAVGTANGKNPLCIIIPCHRVIAADGTLGGYSGGLDKKRKLHALEHITTRG
jgi:methylated-DNA-[protein]-cysteine S-methyltransferase